MDDIHTLLLEEFYEFIKEDDSPNDTIDTRYIVNLFKTNKFTTYDNINEDIIESRFNITNKSYIERFKDHIEDEYIKWDYIYKNYNKNAILNLP